MESTGNLGESISIMKKKLNQLIGSKNANADDILKISQELDELISKYYTED